MSEASGAARERAWQGGASGRIWQRATEAFADERERWALWLPVIFGVGIGLYFLLPWEPDLWPAFALACTGWLAVFLLRRHSLWMMVLIGLAVAATGFARAQLRATLVASPVLEKPVGPANIVGRITDISPHGTGYRLRLDRLTIGRLSRHATPGIARIAVRSLPPSVRVGDVVSLRGVLRPPPGPAAPGAFDFARRAWFEGLGAVGFAMGRVVVVGPAADDGPWVALSRLRHHMTATIRAALPGDSGAMAAALLTGQRGAISEATLKAMRDSGLAHLLAISGLHVGLVAGILFFVLRFGFAMYGSVALRYPVKKWAAAAALCGAFLYLLISGATVPTQRAFLMVAVVMLAVMVDRTAISMRLVAWAAALVLLLAPESLTGASFQMSFAAVIALVAVYEELSGHMRGWHRGAWHRRIALYLGASILTAVVAGMATAPFAAYHFNRLALYGVAANAAAVPLTGFWIMPWGIAALVLMPLGLEELALGPMGWGIAALIDVAHEVSSWPGATRMIPSMPLWGLILIAGGGLWLGLWRRRWRVWGMGAVAAGMASLMFARAPDVLVDGTGRLMALRTDEGGLALSTRAARRFESEIWLRRAGLREASPWGNGNVACDSLGCLRRTGGHTVALVRDPGALPEDCKTATVIVSVVPVRPWLCRRPLAVIDRYDLWRDGAHAIWLGEGSVRVQSVASRQGRRPWSRYRHRHKGVRRARYQYWR